MEPSEYSETRTFVWAWLLLLIAVACLIGGFAGARGAWEDKSEQAVFVSVMCLTAALMGGLGVVFFRYFVTVADGRLRFGYSFWNVELPVADVVSVSQEDLTFGRWLGQGWRIDAKKRIGYIASFGGGVEVRLLSERVYVLSCFDPERLLGCFKADRD